MTRILLLGSNGQVGTEVHRLLPEATSLSRPQLDLTNLNQLRDCIRQHKPDVVINAAAYTAVDRAETESDLAQIINADAPRVMAEEVQAIQAALVHISTDYVFDGQKNTPYAESDVTNPTSVYGQTKLAGEVAVQQACDRHFILRTAWVYGVYGKGNFVKTMLRLGRDREQLRVVTDQVGNPTGAKHIATTIAAMLPQMETAQMPAGIYHVTNSGVTSWYDFAIAIFEEARQRGWPLAIKDVVPIMTADYPTPATRPAYSALDCRKISAILGGHPPHWRASLRQMLAELDPDSLA